jgi:hypothetical protein
MYHWRFETHIILQKLTCFFNEKNLHIWFAWKFIIKNLYFITYYLKIYENTYELNFFNWHYHPIMGSIQNMEIMFQNWKSTVLTKDLHLTPIGAFYCECTLNT